MGNPWLLSFIQVGEVCIPIDNIAYIDFRTVDEARIHLRQSSSRGGRDHIVVTGSGVDQLRAWLDDGIIAIRVKKR